jgi:hypothetical protein
MPAEWENQFKRNCKEGISLMCVDPILCVYFLIKWMSWELVDVKSKCRLIREIKAKLTINWFYILIMN